MIRLLAFTLALLACLAIQAQKGFQKFKYPDCHFQIKVPEGWTDDGYRCSTEWPEQMCDCAGMVLQNIDQGLELIVMPTKESGVLHPNRQSVGACRFVPADKSDELKFDDITLNRSISHFDGCMNPYDNNLEVWQMVGSVEDLYFVLYLSGKGDIIKQYQDEIMAMLGSMKAIN